MEMAFKTWTQVDENLKTSQTLIVPVGSTEQHGPTSLVGTDFLTALEISKMVGLKTKRLVAPSLTCCPETSKIHRSLSAGQKDFKIYV